VIRVAQDQNPGLQRTLRTTSTEPRRKNGGSIEPMTAAGVTSSSRKECRRLAARETTRPPNVTLRAANLPPFIG